MTVTLDRASALRQAEKLLRQGKLDLAIAEYQRIVEDQPHDWVAANQLGDALARAGRVPEAVAQYTRIADALAAEGFLPRASALYKKILKLAPQHDHALVQAGELSAAQGLLADARSFLQTAVERRRQGGDKGGAARLVVRLAALDADDTEARLAGARALVELEDLPRALADLARLAADLVDRERFTEALRPLRLILELDPANARATAELHRILAGHARPPASPPVLSPDVAARHPDLAVADAELRIRSGDEAGGLTLLDRLLYSGDAASAARVADLATRLAPDLPAAAARIVDRVSDAQILQNDWDAAVGTLRAFSAVVPRQVPVLLKLIDVCVDAGRDGELAEAQGRLVDAYLDAGAATEARYVAEDLLVRDPGDPVQAERLRRVLQAVGEPDVDRRLAELRGGHVPDASSHGPTIQAAESRAGDGHRDAPHEIDLTAALDDPLPTQPGTPGAEASAPTDEPDIEDVFARLREAAMNTDALAPGELAFQRGRALLAAGLFEAGEEALRMAARVPDRRFDAAVLLSQLYERQRRLDAAAEWLGHAADAPIVQAQDRHRVLAQLADVLERAGERERALGVCLELQAEAGDVEGVAARIARLSRVVR